MMDISNTHNLTFKALSTDIKMADNLTKIHIRDNNTSCTCTQHNSRTCTQAK